MDGSSSQHESFRRLQIQVSSRGILITINCKRVFQCYCVDPRARGQKFLNFCSISVFALSFFSLSFPFCFRKLGVTAEPEIISQILKGDDHAFIIAFSDGIGGVLSDQEIVDLCRTAKHPQDATKAVLNFAEELGSDDNCTVLCIPLRGWGKIGGKDRTKEEREKRRSRVDVFRDNRQ